MQRICATFAVLSVLATVLFVFGSGTASARTISASKATVTPSCAGFNRDRQWSQNGVTLILWRDNCTQGRHCEGISVSYSGPFQLAVQGTFGSTVKQAWGPRVNPFTPGEIVNSGNLPGGGSGYTCAPRWT